MLLEWAVLEGVFYILMFATLALSVVAVPLSIVCKPLRGFVIFLMWVDAIAAVAHVSTVINNLVFLIDEGPSQVGWIGVWVGLGATFFFVFFARRCWDPWRKRSGYFHDIAIYSGLVIIPSVALIVASL